MLQLKDNKITKRKSDILPEKKKEEYLVSLQAGLQKKERLKKRHL